MKVKLYREILGQRESSRRLEADAVDAGERPEFPSAPACAVDAPAAPATAMVGREVELASLGRALAEPSRQRVAAILGEAGIGKSRLLAEFHTRALLGGARVLLGRSYESARIVPFGPWIDGLRRGRVVEAPALRGLGAVWQGELARLFPELAETEHAPAATSGDPGRLFEAVAQLLEHLAHQQPLVVILEDVHWADDMSLRLLAFLARRSGTASPVLVISARDDDPSPAGLLPVVLAELAAERRLDRVVLGPLSRAQTAELAERLVRVGSDAATIGILADRLWALSHGHPFTIVEAMTALDHGSAVPNPGPLALPERVREVIARRLESLTDRARALAAVAAVIGREFDFTLLRDTAALGEDQTTDGLEELVRSRILRVADDHFDFTHERIREVVITQLLPPRRRLLHRQVAEVLEARAPDAGQPAWSALGTHCWEAGLWEKAARYCREAGTTASAQSADHEAAAWFEQALAALERLPVSADTLAQAVDIRLDLRNSLMLVGAYARIAECMSAAVTAARALDDSRRLAWVTLFAEQIHWWTTPAARAGTFAEKAAAIAASDSDPSLQVTGTIYAGFGWFNAGDYRLAISCFARALDLLRGKPLGLRHGHHSFAASSAHAHLARALAQIGDFAGGLHHAQQAIRLAEEVGHVHSLCMGESALGVIHRIRGDHAAAIPVLEHAATLERGQGWVRGLLGLVYAVSGRVADGIALLEKQRALVESSGPNFVKAWTLHDLGRAYLLAGRLEDASTVAHQALAVARQRGERGHEVLALRLHGDIAARREPWTVEPAGESYRLALAVASELGMRPNMAHGHRALGLLYQRANTRQADDHLARAAALYRELGMSF